MQDFRKLLVWQKAHSLTLGVYKASANFPKQEMFGLTSQIRRSASSIPTNVAEGCGRGSDADFGRFLQIAMGSASEVDYQLLLAHDLGYLTTVDHGQLGQNVTEVKRMLSALITKLHG